MKPKVLITNHVPEEHIAPLLEVAEIIYGPSGGTMCSREEVLALAPELSGIINQHELTIDQELLATAPQLKIVSNVASGYNNLDLDAMNGAGVWGTNCPGVFTESAADYTLGLLLAVGRRMAEADAYVRAGQWVKDGFQPGPWDGLLLNGRTLGIVGFGQIGKAVARRAEGFGMQIVFHDPFLKDDPRYRSIDALLRESDAVSLHIPLTPETHHLINTETLELMKPGSILLNLARGPVVDEAALAVALRSGHLRGAGLDVAENEPKIHPDLLELKNVVFSPHIGGGTEDARKQARLMCAENIRLVLLGEKPKTPVNQI